MKRALLAIALVLGLSVVAHAGEIGKGITPYGDFCPKCSTYGICKKELRNKEAVSALNAYFEEKGFSVGEIKGKGRFLIVDILKEGRLVDRIVFDRKTGRLRSIY